ncbi:FAD-binding oxidoreductase [Corynebacterium cystitidis]|uniref:Delta(24)-sterol reductase n=1 Tax=Corynebacterium cystitidis DSM 20524 TaxID=1121357 RepID=A0A1H9R1X2_9CORY|nr:FAD-binding oxidoreductase [Corynebacterium cystitidis]WJY81582.1 putative xylitol oxidase [Corynebacterium cystitidis DSM 20524]SER66617.1 FAD/FMN-containing dehydrogenase [Corynebacterium cystitidis DSM 20524]SNV85952.1 FAD/FMN-containing dehydrogenase [Corynebacterium cystitidis]
MSFTYNLASRALRCAGTVSNVLGNTFSSRSVDAEEIQPVGWQAHRRGVEALVESFAAVPDGQRVRLAKKTSNVFRGRKGNSAGLDVSGLGGVIEVDPVARTADVQGMCTYEDLVDATLPHGLAPFVVPQLKTITLGGAVTGMGVESTSFRNGLPHESVIEMDILTGTGEIITASRETNVDLYRSFPNSYGSLGYAIRLKIELEPVKKYVNLSYVRYHDLARYQEAMAEYSENGTFENEPIHGLDGVSFSPEESYLIIAQTTDDEGPTSDYTRERIFYQAMRHPDGVTRDRLSIRDYIWRWDTDWFWCSRAFGVQNPQVRAVWPRELRRSAFYWKLIGIDRKYNVEHNLVNRPKGLPHRERVVQDVEVTVDKTAEWLEWFFGACDIQPVWLCPIRLRGSSEELVGKGEKTRDEDAPWPLYPLNTGTTWVNMGFWSAVPGDHVSPEAKPGAFNKVIEQKVSELGGHKSLYSEAFYTRSQFEKLYGGSLPDEMKRVYDPDGRFPSLYDKTVGGA